MALIKEHSITVFGTELTYPRAYHKVENLLATNDLIKVNVEIFNDESKEHAIGYNSFEFKSINHMEPDLIQLAYQLIKTTKEYDGAFDVFEEGQPSYSGSTFE
ncbi:hypothetical protein [Oceanobacillus caeni]|uniref:Uncharacterized protein n=1 Tax=Oceanobacillus caeni TaxID=405946 RepID=A0ABR5MKM4_9BACI|nr:hypothetical protein [Oceanobacillus caeni]KPH76068.1 hypothetical protein AFL42_07115 [Oceanobacillus caeni]